MNCIRCQTQLTSSRQKKYCSKNCKTRDSLDRDYAKNKAIRDAKRAEWRQKNPLRTKYLYAKADIKRRGRGGLHISYEECIILWNKSCAYCSKNILVEKGCSLDRLNNDKGYTPDNVVPCCGDCNTIKSNILSFDEMKVAMTAVMELRRSKT